MTEAKRRILLVDDEPGIRRTVGTRLESEGFDMQFAVDGVEALAKVRVEMPDVIILDVMMPKKGGLEFCAALRKDERFKRLPVILYTGKGQVMSEEVLRDWGADAFLQKTCEPEDLLRKIQHVLNNPRA